VILNDNAVVLRRGDSGEYGRWAVLLTEGHAMWVEIDCLHRKGIGRKYREKEAVSRGICRSTRIVVAKLTP